MGMAYLRQATKLGLGEGDLSKMEIKGLILEDATKIFTEKAYGIAMTLRQNASSGHFFFKRHGDSLSQRPSSSAGIGRLMKYP